MKAGQHLPAQVLADSFKVSRQPVVSALKMLEQMGIVEATPLLDKMPATINAWLREGFAAKPIEPPVLRLLSVTAEPWRSSGFVNPAVPIVRPVTLTVPPDRTSNAVLSVAARTAAGVTLTPDPNGFFTGILPGATGYRLVTYQGRVHAFGGDALGALDAVGLVEALHAGEVSIPDVVDAAIARFGRLDGLVNNASAFFPTPIGEVTAAKLHAARLRGDL